MHAAPHAWSGQLSLSWGCTVTSSPLTPAAATPSCQQQSPFLQILLILFLIQHFVHPSLFKNLLFWGFFISAIKQRTLNQMKLSWKIAKVLTALGLWSTPKLFKYKIVQIQKTCVWLWSLLSFQTQWSQKIELHHKFYLDTGWWFRTLIIKVHFAVTSVSS